MPTKYHIVTKLKTFWQNYTTWSRFAFFYHKKLLYVKRSYILYKNYELRLIVWQFTTHIYMSLHLRFAKEMSFLCWTQRRQRFYRKKNIAIQWNNVWAMSQIQTCVLSNGKNPFRLLVFIMGGGKKHKSNYFYSNFCKHNLCKH